MGRIMASLTRIIGVDALRLCAAISIVLTVNIGDAVNMVDQGQCPKCKNKFVTIFVGDAIFDVACLHCYKLVLKKN